MDLSAPEFRRARLIAGALALVLLIGAGVIWLFAGGSQLLWPEFEFSKDAIEAKIEAWGAAGVAVSIAFMVVHSFIPFPAEFVAMANGMAYGPVWGTVVTWFGAMLGAYLAFGLARWLGRPFVLSMVPRRRHGQVEDWTRRHGGMALLLSRLIPVISFNLINYAAGLTAVSWWTFTWATGLGILPITFLSVFLGDRLWDGGSMAWLWFLAATLAGALVWWAVIVRGQKGAPKQRNP